jgi:hypothetical protein
MQVTNAAIGTTCCGHEQPVDEPPDDGFSGVYDGRRMWIAEHDGLLLVFHVRSVEALTRKDSTRLAATPRGRDLDSGRKRKKVPA